LQRIDALTERATGALRVGVLRHRGQLEAMRGDIATARVLIAEARSLAEELGLRNLLAAGVAQSAGEVELLAGDLSSAERYLRAGCEELERIGDWGHLVTIIPYLADSLLGQGRGEEAASMIERGLERTVADDADAQIGLRRVRAQVLAQRGEVEEAERVARDAASRAAHTDYLTAHAQTVRDLAEVLELAGKQTEAAEALAEAVALYERKGNVVMAGRTRDRLAEIRAAS
jgi:tetratricopeptide (TPR) repeat protein